MAGRPSRGEFAGASLWLARSPSRRRGPHLAVPGGADHRAASGLGGRVHAQPPDGARVIVHRAGGRLVVYPVFVEWRLESLTGSASAAAFRHLRERRRAASTARSPVHPVPHRRRSSASGSGTTRVRAQFTSPTSPPGAQLVHVRPRRSRACRRDSCGCSCSVAYMLWSVGPPARGRSGSPLLARFVRPACSWKSDSSRPSRSPAIVLVAAIVGRNGRHVGAGAVPASPARRASPWRVA